MYVAIANYKLLITGRYQLDIHKSLPVGLGST